MSKKHYKNGMVRAYELLLGESIEVINFGNEASPDIDFSIIRFSSMPDRFFTAGLSDLLYDGVEISLESKNWDTGLEDVFAYIATYVVAKSIYVHDGVNIYNLEVTNVGFGYGEIAGCLFRQLTHDGEMVEFDAPSLHGYTKLIKIYDTILLDSETSRKLASGKIGFEII